METHWKNRGTAPRILNLSATLRWVISFTPRQLYHRVTDAGTHRTGGWAGPRAGLDAVAKRKEYYHCPCREFNPDCLVCSLVSVLNELSRLPEIFFVYLLASIPSFNTPISFFFLNRPLLPCGVEGFLLVNLRQLFGLLGRVVGPTQGLYLHTGQHKHIKTQTHIHAPRMIRTCDLNIRATEDSTCLRPFGYWDRLKIPMNIINIV
jgi:hypothetical protein